MLHCGEHGLDRLNPGWPGIPVIQSANATH
jgi:hypothetical protein